LAFWKLTIHASPNVRATLALEKLTAINSRVFLDVFDTFTRIAFKDIALLRIAGDDTSRALCVEASPRCVSQILWNEVTLRPSQLPLFCGTARAGTSVKHCFVHGMATFGGLFTSADFAANVT